MLNARGRRHGGTLSLGDGATRGTRRVRSLLLALAVLLGSPLAGADDAERAPVVVVDAGHGGEDFGAVGRVAGVLEKDVAFAVASQVGKALADAGIEVIYTRSRDEFVPLADRTSVANQRAADFFLSIHVSYPNADDRRRAAELGGVPGGQIMVDGLPYDLQYVVRRYAGSDWTVGCIAVANGDMFDVWLMLGFGALGYVLKKLDFPLAPLVLALVLGAQTEDSFRQAIIGSRGSLLVFWSNPLVAAISTLGLALLLWPLLPRRATGRTDGAPDAVPAAGEPEAPSRERSAG